MCAHPLYNNDTCCVERMLLIFPIHQLSFPIHRHHSSSEALRQHYLAIEESPSAWLQPFLYLSQRIFDFAVLLHKKRVMANSFQRNEHRTNRMPGQYRQEMKILLQHCGQIIVRFVSQRNHQESARVFLTRPMMPHFFEID